MEPTCIEDWISVARERAADAEAIVLARAQSVGSVYLVGYAVECSLKAYLIASGTRFPTRGPAGHDLTALWKASGFTKRDIADLDGSKSYYFEAWTTSLRYSTTGAGSGLQNEELLNGAKRVVGWLQNQARRKSLKRRRP